MNNSLTFASSIITKIAIGTLTTASSSVACIAGTHSIRAAVNTNFTGSYNMYVCVCVHCSVHSCYRVGPAVTFHAVDTQMKCMHVYVDNIHMVHTFTNIAIAEVKICTPTAVTPCVTIIACTHSFSTAHNSISAWSYTVIGTTYTLSMHAKHTLNMCVCAYVCMCMKKSIKQKTSHTYHCIAGSHHDNSLWHTRSNLFPCSQLHKNNLHCYNYSHLQSMQLHREETKSYLFAH